MRRLAFGLVAALLGSVAFAQTSPSPSGSDSNAVRRPNAEAPQSSSRGSDMNPARSGSSSREQAGTSGQVGVSSGRDASSTTRIGTDTSARSRVNVGVGVERPEGSVRRRTSVRDYGDSPSVTTIHRRRSMASS